MSTRLRSLLWGIAVLANIVSSAYAVDCFSHDGIEALDSKYYEGSEMVSCGNGTNTCCLQGQYCGSDLLCHSTNGAIFRQYCADKNWDGCSSVCAQYDAAGVQLTACTTSNTYCCGVSNSCCGTSNEIVINPSDGSTLSAGATVTGKPVLWAQVTPSSSSLLSSPTPSSSSKSTSSSSSTTQSESSAVTSAASTTTILSETTTAPISSASSASSTDPASPSSSGGLSAGAGAGIGIGCGVGAAGLAALIWLLIRERRKRKDLEQARRPIAWNESQGHYPDQQSPMYQAPHPYQPVPAYTQPLPHEMDAMKTQYHELDTPRQKQGTLPPSIEHGGFYSGNTVPN